MLKSAYSNQWSTEEAFWSPLRRVKLGILIRTLSPKIGWSIWEQLFVMCPHIPVCDCLKSAQTKGNYHSGAAMEAALTPVKPPKVLVTAFPVPVLANRLDRTNGRKNYNRLLGTRWCKQIHSQLWLSQPAMDTDRTATLYISLETSYRLRDLWTLEPPWKGPYYMILSTPMIGGGCQESTSGCTS